MITLATPPRIQVLEQYLFPLLWSEGGATALKDGMITARIAGTIVAVVTALGAQMSTIFTSIKTAIIAVTNAL